jgi:hypothetical protein
VHASRCEVDKKQEVRSKGEWVEIALEHGGKFRAAFFDLLRPPTPSRKYKNNAKTARNNHS